MQQFSEQMFFTADTHISKELSSYTLPSLKKFVNDVKEAKPKFTVIGGDYFDKRINADESIYSEGISLLLELAKYSKYLIIINGTYSHDYQTLNILNTYKELTPNIYFINEVEAKTIDGFDFLFLLEVYPENPNDYYSKFFDGKKYDFIIGHGDIQGAILHSGIDNRMLKGFKYSPTILSDISTYSLFGHIHKHQKLKPNVIFSGSLSRWAYGQEEDKGYLIINNISDIEKINDEFIPIPCTKFSTIEINTIEEIEKLKDISDIENIRIAVDSAIKKDVVEELSLSNIEVNKFKELNVIDENEVMYKDLEKLSVSDQFEKILEEEMKLGKISKKKYARIKGNLKEVVLKYISNS
jgi:DNA repair exonuclease SbcCD nuclease subunit